MIQIKLSGYLVSLTMYVLMILLMSSLSIKCNDGRQFYTYQYITTKTPSESNESHEILNQMRNLKYYGSYSGYSYYSPSYYSYYS